MFSRVSRFSFTPVEFAAVVLGLVGVVFGLHLLWTEGWRMDFGSFYRSGLSYRQGLSPYVDPIRPNLNPPWVVALVFAPLSRLPFPSAVVVWTLVSVGAVVLSARWVWQRQRPAHWAWGVAAIGFGVPAEVAWQQGQVTWLMLPFMTAAWLAARDNRWQAAGLWLAPVLALKPPLVLMALLLPVPIWLVAGIASAVLTLVSMGLTHWSMWVEWFALRQQVNAYEDLSNASVWGVLARVPDRADAIVLTLGLLGLLIAAPRIVRAPLAQRWSAALCWAMLSSPLGWTYYLPLAIPSMLASTPSRATVAALALFMMPPPVVGALAARGETSN